MILNEFLQIKLGVEFEDKYNALAAKEVFENREKYPLIADEIVNEIMDADFMKKEWDYESSFFDCDDLEFCADYDETIELYRAFVAAFARDVKDKPIEVKYASFGLDYLERPNIDNILDLHCHYLGMAYISVFPNRTELGKEIYYPIVPGSVCFGTVSASRYSRTFATENDKTLKQVAEGFKTLCERDELFADRFDNDGLNEHAVTLESGEIGYPCDCYEIRIGENLLRFFSTERGTDALSALRLPILNALTEEQRGNDVAKEIEI